MAKYIVHMETIGHHYIDVEAGSIQEAMKLVKWSNTGDYAEERQHEHYRVVENVECLPIDIEDEDGTVSVFAR